MKDKLKQNLLDDGVSCADLLKVLADETRLAVVQQLLAGAKHVSQMNDHLGVDQSLLSHHLKVLREGGIVESHRDGKSVLYQLTPEVEAMRDGKTINLGCCQLTFDES